MAVGWAWAGLILALGASGCSALASFPDDALESGAEACFDGIDNDLDGQVDCADDSCLCNRCGDLAESPESDALGRACQQDCECEDGEVCNLGAVLDSGERAGRCSIEPRPVGDGLDVLFVIRVERDDRGNFRSAGAQNVVGRVQLDGEVFSIESLRWDPVRTEVDFRGPVVEGEQASILLSLFPLARLTPFSGSPVEVRIDDDILGLGPSDPDLSVINAFFGIYPAEGGSPQALNARAVVATSTLSLGLSPDASDVWRGRLKGRFRRVTGFDRARSVRTCTENEVFEPTQTRCSPIREVLIFFGCPTSDARTGGQGKLTFGSQLWNNFARKSPLGGTGACALRREGRTYRLRGRAPEWWVEVLLDRDDIGANIGLTGLPARMWSASPGDDPSLFPNLGMPEREVDGQLWIDDFSEGPEGRFFGWLAGSLRSSLP